MLTIRITGIRVEFVRALAEAVKDLKATDDVIKLEVLRNGVLRATIQPTGEEIDQHEPII